ncbi:MAG: hypothetical protein LBO82_06440 [Synergistaceae bacterium]|jgi:metal-dependent amidase/aminoacylase/carboxypeptidase family protein|nr:hypothetical protein [Synergistaceae bacterium]
MLNAKLGEWRHHLHMYPELSYREYETTDFIASALREMGYEDVKTGFGALPTGVSADLNAHKTGPRIALRADIDALPIREESGVPFSSRSDGVMHACGAETAREMFGAERCREIPPIAGSDDFSCYGEIRPAAYFFLGMRTGETCGAHHNAAFRVDDAVLPSGAALLAAAAEVFLSNGVQGTSPLAGYGAEPHD